MTEEELNVLEEVVLKAVAARKTLANPKGTLGPMFKVLMDESQDFNEALVPSAMMELIALARKGLEIDKPQEN